MPAIDKTRVGAAFDRAAPDYDGIARFQHTVCDSLMGLLPVFAPDMPSPGMVLDGGCGTGYGSALLSRRWPASRIAGCDLSLEMLRLARGKSIDTICADLEQLPFRDGAFDLVWSSLALQWCTTPDVYAEMYRILAKEGVLLFTTLGPGTLAELDFAFSAIDAHPHVRAFSTPEETRMALKQAGFTDIRIECETRRIYFPDFRAFLTSVRGIGANQVGGERRRALMGKNAWKLAEERYETLRGADGMLPATYEVVFGYGRR
ncbi:MAG: malonyl-ACP O-methyltransferase BioC [Oxalobacter sp.]|nr:malonyl-ACP O-methyltransferase BioC [Oxalobacter sp.]